ncbi:MAG: hypothetical protein HN797_00615 [Tateyamaria sp.]|nr:hypothetical protein [Tateyamaria sp.]
MTTAPHSFVALWGHSAVRAYGQTYIPKNGALLLRPKSAKWCTVAPATGAVLVRR